MSVLAVLGASGHGKVIADAALSAGWQKILFYDDSWPALRNIGIWSVVGNTERMIADKALYDAAVVAIGNNKVRWEKANYLEKNTIRLATIIHPMAVVSRFVAIGEGTVVLAGAVINCDSSLGKSCIVNTRASVDHDCILGNAVHISPGVSLAGQVNIGDLSWVGIGSSVKQQISIGCQSIIGAGAAIINNVEDFVTVVGVPGKQIVKINNKPYKDVTC